MRLGRAPAVDPRWARRADRARVLRAERPHAAPLLGFYLSLLELQAPLHDPAAAEGWKTLVLAPDAEPPRLRLERLPLDALTSRFRKFCRAMSAAAPGPIARAAGAAAAAGATACADLLLALLTGADFVTAASELGGDPAPLAFLPRAFLQPVAEALAGQTTLPSGSARAPTCPMCGWPPQVAALDDEPEAQGVRRLVCALCATAWIFPRSVCPGCGVSGDEGLEFHVDDEGLPHVRVEACRTCHRYLKAVDLRVAGLAVPLVDDLATPELDLWATGQGLEKIAPNLLGL